MSSAVGVAFLIGMVWAAASQANLRAGRRAARQGVARSASTTSRYADAVLADHPTVYFRLGETSGTTAFDSSGHGFDATYAPGVQLGQPGALLDDPDTSASNGGVVIQQSGDQLPAGAHARTLEAWIHNVDYGFNLFSYGDVTGGNGLQVSIAHGAGSITVTAGSQTVSANTLPGFGSGWHLVDVTYNGATAEIYQDGQIIGGGTLGAINTAVPGQGFAAALGGGCCGPYMLDEVAVYPSALTPARIAAHWSAGASNKDMPACASAPSQRYPSAVLADKPISYWRVDELADHPADRVALDYSGHCDNAAYVSASSQPGALLDDPDTSAGSGGAVIAASGDTLPGGATARTLEAWIHNVDYGFNLFSYGDVAAGNGFQVSIAHGAGSISVTAGSNTVTANTLPGFGSGWHLVDVTYDGSTVEIYQDGQLIGGGTLGTINTAVPGQGLTVALGGGCCGPYMVDEPAIYGTALSPARIDAHWTAGASTHNSPACATAPDRPYPNAVLADAPTTYFRLDDIGTHPEDRLAFDYSSHCANAAYVNGTSSALGALPGDDDPSVQQVGPVIFQSGATLPAGSSARTLEAWVHNVDYGFNLFSYGDVAAGKGFQVSIAHGAGSISVTAGSNTVTANTVSGFGSGWHLVDVTYDGTTVEIYQDGQLIGGGALTVDTALPGQGLDVATGGGCCGPYELDEVAIYPTALSPSRINAHWEAASQLPSGESRLGGSATLSGGGGAQGARVQACPTSGGGCIVDPDPVDSSGSFRMLVPDGTYTVTIFPPPGSPTGPQTLGPFTVPPSQDSLSAVFTPPGGMPSGATFSSPSTGTQQNTVPRVFWGEPSTVTFSGCKGGFGVVFVAATNTSTGQPETQAFPLTESPAGSGTYVAQIPPLAPLHGLASVNPEIACPGHTNLLPDGGAPAGGATLLITGSGFTGARGVRFGNIAASSFEVLRDDIIKAVAPPGTAGSQVPVTVVSSTGSTKKIGNFTYFDATGLDTGSGPAAGGNTITIHGSGFTNVTGVMFGVVPSPSVTVVNSGEIQAQAPAGIGTVDVQVVNGFGVSQPGSNVLYSYQGGPAGSSAINEGTGPNGPLLLASQISSSGLCANAGSGPIDLSEMCQNVIEQLTSPFGSGPVGVLFQVGVTAVVAAPVCLISLPACAVVGVGVGLGFLGYDIMKLSCEHGFCPGIFKLFIDPSGTVVNTHGRPVKGATATLLEKSSNGSFSPVDPSSGVIEPNVNPQTTGSSGGFDWDALAGTYQVEASKLGCHAPGTTKPNVFTSPFTIPPAAVGLILTLDCGSGAPPKPAVTGVAPRAGVLGGGDTVDISGTGLTGATAVHFGGAAATQVKVLSPYTIAAVAPAGRGIVDITVTTAGGTSPKSSADKYSYLATRSSSHGPAISSATPARGSLTGGTLVTITGTGLGGAYAVDFGGTPSSRITDVSSREIKAIAPAAQFPERVDISVTTPRGTSSPTSSDLYTYGSAPPLRSTKTILSASLTSPAAGQAVVLTASVRSTDGAGSIAFYAGTSRTPISGCGAVALKLSGSIGTARCSLSKLTVGRHTFTSAYSGDASYAPSRGSVTVSVRR